MALSTRGKALLSTFLTLMVVAGGVVGYLMFTGQGESIPFLGGTRTVICPLTDQEPKNEDRLGRTAVAAKIENISSARPQAGLNEADVVFEEPVEGGITRFVAIYHCSSVDRLGPIRSARFVDPRILRQFGPVVFAYSGGIDEVKRQVRRTGGLQDVNYDSFPDLYTLDPNKLAPHNVYSSTTEILQAAENRSSPPEPVFEFDEEAPPRATTARGRTIQLKFSPATEVEWRYRRRRGLYVRAHAEEPHTAEDGKRVSATNVIVMQVRLRDTGIVDAAGNPSPEAIVVGSGRAFVFRGGRVVEGRWRRESEEDVTEFVDGKGEVIPLAPGRTWIELVPREGSIDFS